MSAARHGARIRAEAAGAIDAVVVAGRSLDQALAEAEERVSADDRPLLRMLCYGTLRHHFRLRWQLGQLLDRPLKGRDSVVESLLAIGLFQLTDTRVPDHAAVSMTVEAARILRLPKYAGLINAVLRNFGRRGIANREPDNDEARHDHPGWLLAALRADWPDDWADIVAANNDRAPMWLRVNRKKASVDDYLGLLGVAHPDVGAGKLPGVADAIRLDRPLPVEALPGFADGWVSVQDAAAQLAAPWLLDGGDADGSYGVRVLDTCAAPGGKTGHLLECLGGGADVTAVESDRARAVRIGENLARLGLEATVIVGDASKPGEWWDGRARDRVLVDAPCSASGVIRRHPDIKVLRRAGDVATLAVTQRAILEALWPVLAPGGRLLYVTCSVLAAENEGVIGPFLAAHPDASERRVLHDYNIRALMRERSTGYQVLPGTADMDGFYYAALEKAAPGS